MNANGRFWFRFLLSAAMTPILAFGALHGNWTAWFSVAGVLANMSAVLVNGKKMPVRGWFDTSERHQPMTGKTRCKLLCDIIPLPWGIASIGDVFLWLGMVGGLGHLIALTIPLVFR